MKATRAIDRLPNVKTAKVSATDGSVTIGLDLEQGPLHRVNSVLTAIGFPQIPRRWSSMRRDTRRRNIDSVAHVAWLARSEANRGSLMLGWRRMGKCSSSSHPRMLLSSRASAG